MGKLRRAEVVGGVALAIGLAAHGCHPSNDPTGETKPALLLAGPSTRPATTMFTHPKAGVSLDYPTTWQTKPPGPEDYDLVIEPRVQPNHTIITLDVPDLPFHIPGMIPLGSVQNGYVDDLKKTLKNVKVEQLTAPSLSHTSARLIRCVGDAADHQQVDIALLMVHSDSVFIVRLSTPTTSEAGNRAIFDQVIASLRWKN